MAKLEEELAALKSASAEPVAWMSWYYWHDGTEVCKVHQGGMTYNGQQPIRSEPLYLHPAPAVQEGWQLVPKEPTEEMCRAGESSKGGSSSTPWLDGSYTPENVEQIYRDMLNAAPKPPVQEDAKGVVCHWHQDNDPEMPGTWASDCGVLWTFTDGGPEENGMAFCHQCGKKLAAMEANNAKP